MKAQARVVAEHQRGRTRCTTLRSSPPLTFRATPEGLHLVGSTAGPVGGDDLALDVALATGASLTVRSAAAQLVMPSPTAMASTMRLAVEVGRAATLRWLPEPTVLVRGADHHLTTVVAIEADADLEWRDEVVLGRHGESAGSLVHRIRIERDGRALLCTEVAVGPAWPTSAGPAGTGGARVLASTVLVGQPAGALLGRPGAGVATSDSDGSVRSAALPLAEGAVLLTALGDDVDATRAALILLGAPEH